MRNNDRCFIDIHVLQTVPPSCVNRDDTGSPKTAVYGGAIRARVSSQAWKRAIREDFRESFAPDQVGFRTKKVFDEITKTIIELDASISPEDAAKKAEIALKNAGLIKDEESSENKKKKSQETEKAEDPKKDKDLEALFFMSVAQKRALARLALEEKTDGNDEQDEKAEKALESKKSKTSKKSKVDKKRIEAYKQALRSNPSIDQLLFGRMVASDSSLNYDAAAQVAHSISTHAVQNEFDYFTAFDDIAKKVVHIDTTEFNSSTLYRYATVDVGELGKELGAEMVEAVKGFVDSFCRAMPTGKQKTFANRTTPDVVYIAVRSDQPVNLSGAFEKPVRANGEGYLEPSERALADFAEKTYQTFVSRPALSLASSRSETLAGVAELLPLSELVERVGACVAARVAGEDAQ